jgi:hypothetical protein
MQVFCDPLAGLSANLAIRIFQDAFDDIVHGCTAMTRVQHRSGGTSTALWCWASQRVWIVSSPRQVPLKPSRSHAAGNSVRYGKSAAVRQAPRNAILLRGSLPNAGVVIRRQ